MKVSPKEIGGDDMDIAAARNQHQSLISHLMHGPGDSAGAMHRAEQAYGLSYWCQWNLRYQRRATTDFIVRVRNAYLAMLEASVRRDLDKLKLEQAGDNAAADVEILVLEAEALLAKIAEKVR